jgi:hypothetical protein
MTYKEAVVLQDAGGVFNLDVNCHPVYAMIRSEDDNLVEFLSEYKKVLDIVIEFKKKYPLMYPDFV